MGADYGSRSVGKMDLVSSCKDKLAYFRIKELKDVLSQLGLGKQGKKQDLVDRILSVLSDEQASKMHGWAKRNSIEKEGIAKIIDDTYRKMQIPGATDLASKVHSGSEHNVKHKEEVVDSFQRDIKVRCPCGSSLHTESMIQCEDPRCHVWQHIACVIIPEKPTDAAPPVPSQFYCEVCRLGRADPFSVTLAQPLPPLKLVSSNFPTDGTNPVQNVDKTFQLTKTDRDLLQRTEYDVQVWCILLNDKVPFRMQWPQYTEMQVNAVPVRATNRPGSQLLGANGRDDGPVITTCTREGINKITIAACDARIFCVGIRIVKRRTVRQVLNLIPKEIDGERFGDALARVCRCIGGGNATDNADSDSDLEVVADSVAVNLRCPLSGSRMKIAGRFKPCAHMGCFDLETFVELNQRSRKWQCPICLKNYSLENVIIDPYFNRITNMMRDCGEDVTDIDVKPDGAWRAKHEKERLDLAQWHSPDGSLLVTKDVDVKPNLETLKQIKQEGGSEGHTGLKLGIKKNRNGMWEVKKPDDTPTLSSGNRLEDKFFPKVMPMSSSATGSYREGEDASVNQDGGGRFDLSTNNGNELDSVSLNFESSYGVPNIISSQPTANDVIVLSDSEDEEPNIISPTVFETDQDNTNNIPFSIPLPPVPNSYPEVGIEGFDEEMGLWPSLPDTEAGPGFQFLSNGLVDMQHASVACPTSTNGYSLPPDSTVEPGQVPYSSCRSSSNMNSELVDNPLAFCGDDPSLQIFLPPRPSGASAQVDMREQPDISNGVRAEDWISLRLGGGSNGESAAVNGLNSRHQSASKEGRMEALADTASFLLSMNDDRPDRTNPKKPRSDDPFSCPRQPRSVRPRLYLSIDTDSD